MTPAERVLDELDSSQRSLSAKRLRFWLVSAVVLVFYAVSWNLAGVQIGDHIGGWEVSQIEERRLLLSLDDRSATFTLFNRKAADKPRDQPQQYGMLQTASSAAEAPRSASRRRN